MSLKSEKKKRIKEEKRAQYGFRSTWAMMVDRMKKAIAEGSKQP